MGIGRNGWMVDVKLCAFVTHHGILIQNGHKQDLETNGVFEKCEFFYQITSHFLFFTKSFLCQKAPLKIVELERCTL